MTGVGVGRSLCTSQNGPISQVVNGYLERINDMPKLICWPGLLCMFAHLLMPRLATFHGSHQPGTALVLVPMLQAWESTTLPLLPFRPHGLPSCSCAGWARPPRLIQHSCPTSIPGAG